jgi:hypothetical protein
MITFILLDADNDLLLGVVVVVDLLCCFLSSSMAAAAVKVVGEGEDDFSAWR